MTSDFETVFLHRIKELPFDPDAEIFREYPGLKLGVARCVRYYSQLLLPRVKELITNDSENSDWILTAPAMTAQTPAAANLLCWDLFDLLTRDEDARTFKLSLIDIQHDSESRWGDWKDPSKSQDYAKLDFADRVTEHERLTGRLPHNADFHQRPILFVNDIRVTGAQQHAMQHFFERGGAACVRWLYVIVVDSEIGRREPTIEWQINLAPFGDLLRMVSGEEIQFTGKCLQRLMSLSLDELDQILRALDGDHRKRLLELAGLNAYENKDSFHEQMDLVRWHATQRKIEVKSADGRHVGT